MDARAEKAPCLESQNSVHVKGSVTWTNTFWNCSSRSSMVPELSMTMSALDLFKSRAICAFVLFLASSSLILSLAMSRWSCVSVSTQTTIMGFVHLSILASNNKGMSRTITLQPFNHNFKISQKMPEDIKGAKSLKVFNRQSIRRSVTCNSVTLFHRTPSQSRIH